MKVSELIEKLQELPGDMPVYAMYSDGGCGCACGDAEYDEVVSIYPEILIEKISGWGSTAKYKQKTVAKISVF